MKLFAIALAAAALFAVPAVTSSPAAAQSATITTGPGGPSVVVRERGGDYGRRVVVRERDGDYDRRRWRRDRDNCRTVIERTRRGNGTVVVRRTRICR